MRQYVLQRCFERLISQRQEGKPVIQLRHQQPSLWEGLFAQEVAELWEPWMRVVDQLLEDEELLEAVYQAQGKRHRRSRTRGRRQTPAELALRMLILKHVRNWSYEIVEREVRANVVYRSFCRIGLAKVPDEKTLLRLGQAIGPETIRELHDRIVSLAQQRRVIQGRKLRVDTTVVESNIHYPLSHRQRLAERWRAGADADHETDRGESGQSTEESAQPDAHGDQTGDRHRTSPPPQRAGRGTEAQKRISATATRDAADSQRFAKRIAGGRGSAAPPSQRCAPTGRTAGNHGRSSPPSGAADQGARLRRLNPISGKAGQPV